MTFFICICVIINIMLININVLCLRFLFTGHQSRALTWLDFWHLILPEEASCHHQWQYEEEHQTQLGPFHLHPAGFSLSFEFNNSSSSSSRRSNSRGWLMHRQTGTHEHSKLAHNVSVCYLTPSDLHSFSCFWSLTHRDKILSLTLTSVVQQLRNPLVNM